MRLAEEWCYYFLVLIAGYISLQSQEVIIITLSAMDLLFQLPIAMSLATSTLVGNALGQSDLTMIWHTVKTTMLVNLILTAVVIVAMQPLLGFVAELYTEEATMIKHVQYNMQIYLCTVFFAANLQYGL